jgi:hypothetical protein
MGWFRKRFPRNDDNVYIFKTTGIQQGAFVGADVKKNNGWTQNDLEEPSLNKSVGIPSGISISSGKGGNKVAPS